jgi:transcriptional regulator with XRE-family HTH domain
MRCTTAASEVLREARARQGISQRALAVRAGTSQDAISRIERGAESPTLERLSHLLMVLGERLELRAAPLSEPKEAAPLGARERLREAVGWNLVATKLEIAGAQAREANHPATRPSRPSPGGSRRAEQRLLLRRPRQGEP